MVQGGNNFESGRAATRELLQHAEQPTAIFANNDEMAIGALYEIHKMGLKVPTDISLAGFDDMPAAEHVWPPLTTIRQPFGEIGRTAASVLIDQFQHQTHNSSPNSSPNSSSSSSSSSSRSRVIMNWQLIRRQSTAKCKT